MRRRTLAIGDIHGCFRALSTLEEFVPFERSDRIITLGDYVNRGPDSRSVLEWLIARAEQGGLIPLRGNHELMMCAAKESPRHFDEWIASGGGATLRSYTSQTGPEALECVPAEHWRFIEQKCRPYFETSSHFFVHANVRPDIPLDEQPDYMLYWEKFNDPPAHESGKTMVCGHTPQPDGPPRSIGHAICIDTGVYRGGWLTCLDVDSGTYWQANQQGQTRSGWLCEIQH
jgi:serine/threonine protein phosphatase 1